MDALKDVRIPTPYSYASGRRAALCPYRLCPHDLSAHLQYNDPLLIPLNFRQAQIEKTKNKIKNVEEQQEKFLATGGDKFSMVFLRMQYDLDRLR